MVWLIIIVLVFVVVFLLAKKYSADNPLNELSSTESHMKSVLRHDEKKLEEAKKKNDVDAEDLYKNAIKEDYKEIDRLRAKRDKIEKTLEEK
jgi:hypothetical protein